MSEKKTDFSEGPFLTSALFCEQMLHESDNLISIIRIVDKVALINKSGNKIRNPTLNLSGLIAFKAGKARGEYILKLTAEGPKGKLKNEHTLPIFFSDDDGGGINYIMKMNLEIEVDGLYWFSVYLNEVFITKIPLRILYKEL